MRPGRSLSAKFVYRQAEDGMLKETVLLSSRSRDAGREYFRGQQF
jgi:hypothetical protein